MYMTLLGPQGFLIITRVPILKLVAIIDYSPVLSFNSFMTETLALVRPYSLLSISATTSSILF